MEPLEMRARAYAGHYPKVKKVALSYSGGLDSVVAGSLLAMSGFEVLPIVVDLGQKSDFKRIEKNARKMFGSCSVVDTKEHFAENILRGIKASCNIEGHVNVSGMARPALARALAEEARKSKCNAIAHGSPGTGNDHLTMENALRVLAPEMRIMAPVRDLDMKRDEALEFAKKHKLATNLPRAKQFSSDENLFARIIRQGISLDPTSPLPEGVYKWTNEPKKAPSKGVNLEVEFSNGIPVMVKVEGKKFSGTVALIEKLNEIGGKHAVGRIDAMDDKVAGLKIREVYECPAALILLTAHKKLESIVLTAKELDIKHQVDCWWNRVVHDGGWYTRLRRSLDALIDQIEKPVDGVVSLQLHKGAIIVRGRKSRHALYDQRLSARDRNGVFSQKEARHFAKLYSLQDNIAYMIDSD